jgi:DNA-binding NtrC family response regulator
MDMRMGGITGLETLRRIRQSDSKLLVILMTAYGTTQTAIEAMKLGAYDYLLKPFDVPKLKEIVATRSRPRATCGRWFRTSRCSNPRITNSASSAAASHAAGLQAHRPVGRLGRHRAHHRRKRHGQGTRRPRHLSSQQRSEQPFLAINCAAIPEQLLESELFGHERGAFTGATNQRIGKFEQCNGGTIFLDEIGDMTPATQTKILRVLQSGTFERVGGNAPLKVDVRVIAATNKPLEQAVAARQFREDLFYRLNVVRIHLPPLRERKSDIRCWWIISSRSWPATARPGQVGFRRRASGLREISLAGQRARAGERHPPRARRQQG